MKEPNGFFHVILMIVMGFMMQVTCLGIVSADEVFGQGDILVADAGANAIYKVDFSSGTPSKILVADELTEYPKSMTLENNGNLIVNVRDPAGGRRLIRIDHVTGQETVFAPGVGNIRVVADVATDGSGNIIAVGGQSQGAGGTPAYVIKIDPLTGSQTVITQASPSKLLTPISVSVAPNGDIMVLNRNLVDFRHSVVKVDPAGDGSVPGSAQTVHVVSEGLYLFNAQSLEVEESGDMIVSAVSGPLIGTIWRVDKAGGTSTSSGLSIVTGGGNKLISPRGIDIDATGQIIVASSHATVPGRLWSVDPAGDTPGTNDGSSISSVTGTIFSRFISDVVVIPPNESNSIPVAVDDPTAITAYEATEDTQLVVVAPGVLDNDVDDDNDPLTAVKVSNPTNGTLDEFSPDGSFKYTPNQDYCGPDSFTYHANDGTGDSNVATVSITVTCVNDAPVAIANNYTHDEDTTLTGNVITDNTGEGIDFDVDGDALMLAATSSTLHGTITFNPDDLGGFSYEPFDNYCGPDEFGYSITEVFPAAQGPTLPSNSVTVSITVVCVNDAPVAIANNYTHDEDTTLTGNVITDNTGEGIDFDVDGDALMLAATSSTLHGTITFNPDDLGGFSYEPFDNYCGPDEFGYSITEVFPAAQGPTLPSNSVTVSITVVCVNDPPTVTSVVPGEQISDYSDDIGTVVITVNDVDNVSTTLEESNEPPLSAAGLSLTFTGCSLIDTESPAEDGSDCTWSYDGQVLDPGDNVHDILFTASDGDGAGSVTGTHTLNIVSEEAIVQLNIENEVTVEVTEAGGAAPAFSLRFMAQELVPDNLHGVTGSSAAFGDLNEMVPYMTLIPVGPGSPVDGACDFDLDEALPVYPGEAYGQKAYFECFFDPGLPVNTYEVVAAVDGTDGGPIDETRYYTGSDDDALVVFDTSLGFTTAGGWFYWPGTADPSFTECGPDGYLGDKTNFGYVMKYIKKSNKVKGNALIQRHIVDPVTCWDAGSYRVKSNALYGLAIGGSDYGWAALAGKATYREPGGENEGNYQFLIYAEDHDEQGCNQDPSDRFWVQVKDKDDLVIAEMQLNGPDPAGNDGAADAEDIMCGNVYVPHKPKGGGKPD